MDMLDTFQRLDAEGIRGYVKDQQPENLVLEFKTITKSDFTDTADRRNFAKALSGFANSSGGVVVWGVVAKPVNGFDAACDEQLIDDVARFVSKLNDQTAMSVRPAVDGVLHRAIPVTGNGAGFAVSLIPESATGPHMAMAREGRYYKRSGSSFLPMEHFDIADMFGKRRRPVLELHVEARSGRADHVDTLTTFRGCLMVVLQNVGRGTATDLYVELYLEKPYAVGSWGVDGNGNETLPRVRGYHPGIAFGGGGVVLHPGMKVDIATLEFSVPFEAPIDEYPTLVVEAKIAASDLGLDLRQVNFSGRGVKELMETARPSDSE